MLRITGHKFKIYFGPEISHVLLKTYVLFLTLIRFFCRRSGKKSGKTRERGELLFHNYRRLIILQFVQY